MALTLISGGLNVPIDVTEAENRQLRQLALLSDARTLEKTLGRNAYSDYLVTHGRRPPSEETGAIAKLLGVALLADDGRLYPRPSRTAKALERQTNQAFKRYCAQRNQARRFLAAVEELARAGNEGCASSLFSELERESISALLDNAVSCLFRIKAELAGEQIQRRAL